MKNDTKKRVVGLSIVAALFIGTAVDAGKIVSNASYTGDGSTSSASADVTANKQFGFGGWNLDNVIVKIVNILDFNTALGGYTFDESTGFYTPMDYNLSFESEIYSTGLAGDTAGQLRGKLHGKNWPVGEPSGVKVIHADTKVTNGKPENCIINSSYLEGFYLDGFNAVPPIKPQPVICSSDFQTHKRFKINMLPSMDSNVTSGVADWGKPVDMVFNLVAGDTTFRRYQVFQKIDNYTSKRLDGYKIEVLDAHGNVNPNLTLSLGVGERTSGSNPTPVGDIFAEDARATFSDGLWGPIDTIHNRPRGFFDDATAYYNVADNHHSNVIVGGTDGFLGANYKSLFGNWLPSAWAPKGIFYDFDNDPTTDADLIAFYGDPLHTGTNGWHKGEEDNWATPTAQEMLAWNGARYTLATIEDTLNLGINYIVEIGDLTGADSNFTIRITPHTDSNQTAPTYVADTIVFPTTYTSSAGMASIIPTPTFVIGNILTIAVGDADLNADTGLAENHIVTVMTSKGESELVTLMETGVDTGIFTGTLLTVLGEPGANNDGTLSVETGTTVTVTYTDANNGTGGINVPVIATTTAGAVSSVVTTTTDDGSSGGGGGFDAYDTASFIAMVLGFLGIGAFIARRRLANKA